MDLLTPEALGGAGVTIGGIGLVVFIRFVFGLGGVAEMFRSTLKEINKTLTAHRKHIADEEKHHVVEIDLLGRIETNTRAGLPRPVSAEHTPVRGVEVSPQPPA